MNNYIRTPARCAFSVISLAVSAMPFPGSNAPDPLTITDVVESGGLWANDAGFYDLNAFGTRTLRAAPQISTRQSRISS